MFPAIMYVSHLEKHKLQKIKNHDITTEKQAFYIEPKIFSNLDLNAHVLRKMALLSFCTIESLSIMRIRADIKQMREKVF